MGWNKNGLSIQTLTAVPDFDAYAGYMYINTTDGTLYVSQGSGLWSAFTLDSNIQNEDYIMTSGITLSGVAATEAEYEE